MPSRTERHRELAEAAIREHQALTNSHLEGRSPTVVDREPSGKPTTFFTAQMGEHAIDGAARS